MLNLNKVCSFISSTLSKTTSTMEHPRDGDDTCDGSLDGSLDESLENALAAPGRFHDLLELLEELDHNSPRDSLAGKAFFVTPAQYLTLSQMELPDLGPSDYSDGILVYKPETSIIHHRLVIFLAYCLGEQVTNVWMNNAVIKQLLGNLMVFTAGIADNAHLPTVAMAPDVAILFMRDPMNRGSPAVAFEVMYAHRFTREQAEKRYKRYFGLGQVKVVVCLRLYYGRGVERSKQTAEHFDRSSVSLWIMDKNGNIQTILG